MVVDWTKCEPNRWCNLLDLNLGSVDEDTEGVYVIWSTGNRNRAVYVGQGNIRQRLAAHRIDDDILDCKQADGNLLVTWAEIHEDERDGVERYLADHYDPVVGDIHPDADPITVNLPGS